MNKQGEWVQALWAELGRSLPHTLYSATQRHLGGENGGTMRRYLDARIGSCHHASP